MKDVYIEKKLFRVNIDEYKKIHHNEYNNLNILDQLGFHERQISLLKEISKLYEKKINIRMNNVTHGGFIPIKCSDYFNNIYINNDKKHSDNIFHNIVNHIPNNKNIYYYREIVEIKNLYEINFDQPELSIIISLNNNEILKNMKVYKLTNLTTEWTQQSTLYIHVSNLIINSFENKFKYYFNENGELDYDNLIHLCIMVKNGGPQFEDMLKKNMDIVDRWTILDTGSTDNTIEIINKTLVGVKNGELYQEPFINFRDSRNRCLDLAGKDCKFIVMLDDTYIIQGNLREFLNVVRGDQYSSSFTLIIKSDDVEYGSNRIIKSESGLRYIHKIHEVITDKENINVVIPMNKSYIFDGRFDYMEERTYNRKELDLKLLYEEVEDDPNNPRSYYYLAQTYNQLKDYEKAFFFFMKRCEYINSGFLQERVDAAFEAARIANFQLNKPWEECLSLYERAFKIDESRPETQYFIGIHYYLQGDYAKSYTYLKKGFEIGYPIHCQYSLKPTLSFHFLPKFLTRVCMQPAVEDFNLGQSASEFFLKNNNPNSDDYEEILSYYKIYQKLNSYNPNSIPIVLKENKPLFVFVADGGFNPWSGKSILTTGVGGSETYIIEMARHIQRMGQFQVVVFCNCQSNDKNDNEIFEGVYYIHLNHYTSFIFNNKIHTCIISRYSEYIPLTYKGLIENVYLVLHDLTPSGNVIFMDPKIKNIFCLTEWHCTYFKERFSKNIQDITVPFYYGIDTDKFVNRKNIQKVPYRFIYSSFPNRGLLPLLQMWPLIYKKQPLASLHIYSDVDGKWVNQVAPEHMNEIRRLLEEYKKESKNMNIAYHGWVDKQTLADAWHSADIWFYPCIFMETFCLTALEAAMTKTLVITNDLAALQNTVGDRGVIIKGDPTTLEWKERAIYEINKYISNISNEDIDNNNKKQELIHKNYEWAKVLTWENQAKKLVTNYVKPIDSYTKQENNLIFITLFFNEGYIKLLDKLLYTLHRYGNLDKSTNILIYTSSILKRKIEELVQWIKYFSINFSINDSITTKLQASKSRFDLFNILDKEYQNILYLDTDIVINSDINHVFQICQEDKLYASYENGFSIDNPKYGGNWGGRLFSREEINNIKDKRGVNSGILLMKNGPKVRKVFEKILCDPRNLDDIYDQEFINYHFIKENLLDKDKLSQYTKFLFTEDYGHNFHHNIPILHFYIQGLDKKISLMDSYIINRNNEHISQSIINTKRDICDYLFPIVQESKEYLEGCFFSEHLSNTISDFRIENASSICDILSSPVLSSGIKNILEIGFNAGFSTLLMLTVNPDIHITCVDIGEHKYTIPCYEWISKKFPNRIRFIKGNSEEVLPELIKENMGGTPLKYDMIHIDGGHSVKTFFHDAENSIRMSKKDTVLVVDDYDFQYINLFWNILIDYYKIKKYRETKTQSVCIYC